MSDKDKKVQSDTVKKRGISFWLVAISAIALVFAYQSGRSSGVRSVMEISSERVASPAVESISVVSLDQVPAAPRAVVRPSAADRRESVGDVEFLPAVLPSAPEPVVVRRAASSSTASSPARVVESVPPAGLLPEVIGAVDMSQNPIPAPVRSVYDRHDGSTGFVRASELGLLPLSPLEPLTIPLPGAVQPAAPRTTFRETPGVVRCDCGVVH
jgi:hypothetical protein